MDSMKTKIMIYLRVDILCLTIKEKIYQGYILIQYRILRTLSYCINLYYGYNGHHKIKCSF